MKMERRNKKRRGETTEPISVKDDVIRRGRVITENGEVRCPVIHAGRMERLQELGDEPKKSNQPDRALPVRPLPPPLSAETDDLARKHRSRAQTRNIPIPL